MKSKTIRGLQEIHTMSERISQTDNPQRKYLTLAMLELEKARRNKERISASQRVENIDRRVAEIQEEQASLLAVAEAELAEASPADGSDATDKSEAGQGFNLTY
jgi:predicted  nucleic acid-binding Zn-ribbon protein